jgi:hypothetical protein
MQFAVPGKLHDMPKHPEKFFPKFDPDKKDSVEDHVKKFLLAVRLQNIDMKMLFVGCSLILLRTMLQHGSFLWKKLLSPVGEF